MSIAYKKIDPMLATLTSDYFSSPDWIYERKWDGIRIIAFKNGEEVKLITRNQKDYSEKYPHIVEALKKQKTHNYILDGEVVAFQDNTSGFSLLQRRALIGEDHLKLKYCVFDLLYFNDQNLTEIPLIDRKELLSKSIKFNDLILLTEYIINDGLGYLKKACSLGWEGIIAKFAQSKYIQQRTKYWLKFKCHQQQEFIIIGYTESTGMRTVFGALLLGYYENNTLVFAGKVGTGFSELLLTVLTKHLKLIEISKPAQLKNVDVREVGSIQNIHWVKPLLVAEIKFTEWTNDGKLRHPSFLGLRFDKDPLTIVRETPANIIK